MELYLCSDISEKWTNFFKTHLLNIFHVFPFLLNEVSKCWFKQCARSSVYAFGDLLHSLSGPLKLLCKKLLMTSDLIEDLDMSEVCFPLGNFNPRHDFTCIYSSIIFLCITSKLESLAMAFVVISFLNLSKAFGHFKA